MISCEALTKMIPEALIMSKIRDREANATFSSDDGMELEFSFNVIKSMFSRKRERDENAGDSSKSKKENQFVIRRLSQTLRK
jgi:hypothetical protein